MTASSSISSGLHRSRTQVVRKPLPGSDDGSTELVPTLPPLQLINHDSSFMGMFDATPRSAGVQNDDSQIPAPSSSGLNTAIPESLRIGSPKAPQLAEFDQHHMGSADLFFSTSTAVQYTSSDSSTIKSRLSDGSPPTSRPSSRSSVDESPNSHQKANRPSRALPLTHQELTKTSIHGHEASKAVKSPKVIDRSRFYNNTSSTTTSSNKPLPPRPINTSHVELSLGRTSMLGSIRVKTPEPPRSKRGERLGQQMVEMSIKPVKLASPRAPSASRGSAILHTDLDKSVQSDWCDTKVRSHKPKSHSFLSSTPQRILLKVLVQLNDLDDLQRVSMVNKGFQSTFKRHEQDLVSCILYRTSLPVWELRQIMKCEHKRSAFRLRSVQRDTATIRALQSFVLMKCETLCRSATIEALAGRDLAGRMQMDNALWRIWTFCRLFGKNKVRENTFNSQLVWLDGGERRGKDSNTISLGVGNHNGLSIPELEDISEMWSCLEALLGGFRNREDEARKAGIFDYCAIDDDDNVTERGLLSAWIYDILSLGPKAVLTLTSCSFQQARVLGITNWTPPEPSQTRANFLRGAVEHIYRERLVSEARSKAQQFEKLVRSRSALQTSPTDDIARHLSVQPPQSLHKDEQTALQIQGSLLPGPSKSSPARPIDSAPLPARRDTRRISQTPVTPVFSSFALTSGASVRLGATLFPMDYTHQQPRRQSTGRLTTQAPRRMSDPVDLALLHLVRDRKFSEAKARRALAMSDNGSGIDLRRAIALLTNHPLAPRPGPRISELPGSPVMAQSVALPADNTPQFDQIPSRTIQNAPKQRNFSKKPPRRSSTPLDIIVDTDSEDSPRGNEQVSGYMHQPIEPPAHRHSFGNGPSSRASISQKLRLGRPGIGTETSRSASVHRIYPRPSLPNLNVSSKSMTQRASTVLGAIPSNAGMITAHVLKAKIGEKRPGCLWSFKEDH